MKYQTLLISAALAFGAVSFASATPVVNTDHATFDSTNPANVESGTFCQVNNANALNTVPRGWKLNVSATNTGATMQEFRVRDNGGGFVRYQVPPNSSLGFTMAAGNNKSSGAFRTDATGATTLSGYVSAELVAGTPSGSSVFCTSCDEDDSGHAFCDARIPN